MYRFVTIKGYDKNANNYSLIKKKSVFSELISLLQEEGIKVSVKKDDSSL